MKTFDKHLASALRRGYVAAWRWLGDTHSAHTACAEARDRAFAARGQYDAKRPFYPWFYRVLRSVCDEMIRRRPSNGDSASSRSAKITDRLIATSKRQAAILLAISRLPENMREVLELSHLHGLSHEDVAAIIGVQNGEALTRIYLARAALRDVLLRTPAYLEAA